MRGDLIVALDELRWRERVVFSALLFGEEAVFGRVPIAVIESNNPGTIFPRLDGDGIVPADLTAR